jgi:hypothetical protein
MEIGGIKIADWAEAEYRKKIREERSFDIRAYFHCLVAFLLLAVVSLFILNKQPEFQGIVSTKLHLLGNKFTTSDKLETQALKHENEVNQITQ